MANESLVHVARQPIFDSNQNVWGYELLFRDNAINACTETDGDQATHTVISNSFLLIGIESLTNGKRAFINFTANSIINNIPGMLPKELVAIEILESVFPDDIIIDACKKLKQAGYCLVLDDFIYSPEYIPLIELADIIKVDFRTTSLHERGQLIQRLQNYSVKFLAEKVEAIEEFQDAKNMGYSYFQGYFFCKPVIMSGTTLPGYKANYFQILQELNRPELDFKRLEDIVKKDLSLSYKLLKLTNSPIFGFRNKISSLRQALTFLGQKELAKWMSLLALKSIGADKPGELILASLIRARFAESLASGIMPKPLAANAFLMGMFSHIDALLDRPLEKILAEIPLAEEIKLALLAKSNCQFALLYKVIQFYEKGDWDTYSQYAHEIGLTDKDVLGSYREALTWAHDLLMCNE